MGYFGVSLSLSLSIALSKSSVTEGEPAARLPRNSVSASELCKPCMILAFSTREAGEVTLICTPLTERKAEASLRHISMSQIYQNQAAVFFWTYIHIYT